MSCWTRCYSTDWIRTVAAAKSAVILLPYCSPPVAVSSPGDSCSQEPIWQLRRDCSTVQIVEPGDPMDTHADGGTGGRANDPFQPPLPSVVGRSHGRLQSSNSVQWIFQFNYNPKQPVCSCVRSGCIFFSIKNVGVCVYGCLFENAKLIIKCPFPTFNAHAHVLHSVDTSPEKCLHGANIPRRCRQICMQHHTCKKNIVSENWNQCITCDFLMCCTNVSVLTNYTCSSFTMCSSLICDLKPFEQCVILTWV